MCTLKKDVKNKNAPLENGSPKMGDAFDKVELNNSTKKKRAAPSSKKKVAARMIPTGVPEWLGRPDEFSEGIRSRLGISVVTYHPIPVVNGGTARLLGADEVCELRSSVWRRALIERGEGIIIVSMDPGTRNFALRVERRFLCGRSETLYFNVLDLDPEADARRADVSIPEAKRRKTGKSDDEGVLRTHSVLHSEFYSNPLRQFLKSAHVVLFERQEFDNLLATRTSMHAFGIVAALLSEQSPDECTYALVAETNTKLKNQVIEVDRDVAEKACPGICEDGRERVLAPFVKNLTRHFLKKSGTSTSRRILAKHGDLIGMEALAALPRGRKGAALAPIKDKKDDLADTVCHIEAWRALVGWKDSSSDE